MRNDRISCGKKSIIFPFGTRRVITPCAAAADEFRLLLAHLPENGRLRGYLAEALWLLGKEDEAKTACTIALLLDPAAVNIAALLNPSCPS
jgi:hypothetical protein